MIEYFIKHFKWIARNEEEAEYFLLFLISTLVLVFFLIVYGTGLNSTSNPSENSYDSLHNNKVQIDF